MTINLQDVAEPLEHLWQAQFGCYVHGVTGFDGAAVELEIVAEHLEAVRRDVCGRRLCVQVK